MDRSLRRHAAPPHQHRGTGSRALGRLLALLVILGFPLGACSSSQSGAYKPLDGQAPGGAVLTVTNGHVQDMRIYLLRGATRIPLGSVSSAEHRTFALPTSMIGHMGEIRLMADPLGDRSTYESGVIPVGPGDRVEWRLAPSLSLSSYWVHLPIRL